MFSLVRILETSNSEDFGTVFAFLNRQKKATKKLHHKAKSSLFRMLILEYINFKTVGSIGRT